MLWHNKWQSCCSLAFGDTIQNMPTWCCCTCSFRWLSDGKNTCLRCWMLSRLHHEFLVLVSGNILTQCTYCDPRSGVHMCSNSCMLRSLLLLVMWGFDWTLCYEVCWFMMHLAFRFDTHLEESTLSWATSHWSRCNACHLSLSIPRVFPQHPLQVCVDIS